MADCRKCADFAWCMEEECGLFKPKPQTKADCIRAMSDEELAAWLADHPVVSEYDDKLKSIPTENQKTIEITGV